MPFSPFNLKKKKQNVKKTRAPFPLKVNMSNKKIPNNKKVTKVKK
jgi:hypothetical protein